VPPRPDPNARLRARCGAAVKNEFCLDNNDVGSAFSGDPEPSITIDDIVFFGITSAPWKPNQGPIGGNATGDTYQDYLDSQYRQPLAFDRLATIVGAPLAGILSAEGTASLQASLSLASQPLSTPLNFQRGALGDVDSLEQAPFDVNRTENELNVEVGIDFYQGDELRISGYGVFRPVYDAVYEVSHKQWGDSAQGGQIFDARLRSDLGASTAPDAISGKEFESFVPPRPDPNARLRARCGAAVKNEFCLDNNDVGSAFSGDPEPSITIDDIVFFGITSAPWKPNQGPIGGNATGDTYQDYLESDFRVPLAFDRLNSILQDPPLAQFLADQGTLNLQASLALARTFDPTLNTPLNFGQGALGDRDSLEQAPFDVNRTENQLKFDCLDNAHPWCFVREAYLELEWRDTLVRVGRQQVVWGKTDAFRLQDIAMPIDIGYHNIFPMLEERRIPQLSLNVIQGLRDIGPLKDVSVEFVWNFDRFLPLQFGQCGEPYAYTQACQGRVDAAAHQVFNFALAGVDERAWTFRNTEPGGRIEFRIPEPSISFSISAYYGFQDLPVARFRNPYSTENPNPAALLFLQGLGVGFLVDLSAGVDPANPSGWQAGFNPYDGDEVQATSDVLLTAWENVMSGTDPLQLCAGAPAEECAKEFGVLALPWTASEAVLEYPRVLTLGASADYQIPGIDTILRIEVAGELDRKINNTLKLDGVDSSDVFLAVVGLDRPTYIPFLNRNRTAFLTFQTFFEHIVDYEEGGRSTGMVPYEDSIISTFQMQNFWRNDSIILTNLVAYDWMAQALIWGPKLRWIMTNNVFFDVGVNMLWGGANRHQNILDMCPGEDGGLSCVADPTTWNDGQWQALNADLQQSSQSPWWSKQSFADRFMEKRDEFYVGFTYQF
jgi:hypothetical protein